MTRRAPADLPFASLAIAAALCGAAAPAQSACTNYGYTLAPGSVDLGPGQGGTFSVQVGGSPRTAVVGDFNGDRWPDIATANFGSNNVTILLGNANGNGTSPKPRARP